MTLSIIESLIDLDKQLLLAVNGCHNAFFDDFFYIFSDKFTWIPTALVLFYASVRSKGWQQGLIAIGALLLAVLLADQISSGLFKPLFQRFRPTHEPSLTDMVHIVNGYTGGRYGFVSSHAAIGFAVALFTTLLSRNRYIGIAIFSWALLSSYSRIYLGVHYPGDILGGAIVGTLASIGVYALLKRFFPTVADSRPWVKSANIVFLSTYTATLVVIAVAHFWSIS